MLRPGPFLIFRPAAEKGALSDLRKIILVPDSFKGSLTAAEVCDILGEVFSRHFPEAELVRVPLADGGEGSTAAFLSAVGGERRVVRVQGPFGEEVRAPYAILPGKHTAVIEMAACAGLPLAQAAGRLDPGRATTYGVGQMILDALQIGCREILLCLGGSATNDGGAGCAAALGVRFLDSSGRSFVPVGDTLQNIAHIDLLGRAPVLAGATLKVLCDIKNPLCGPRGAAAVFAPQKGASPDEVLRLDAGLAHLAAVAEADLGVSVINLPGAGAAGGMGAGAVAFLGATLCPGIDLLLDLVGFDGLLKDASLVLTGEGCIDGQTAQGKVIAGVARRARVAGVPVIAFGGVIGEGAWALYDMGVTAMVAADRAALPFEQAAPRAAADLRRAAEDACRLMTLNAR